MEKITPKAALVQLLDLGPMKIEGKFEIRDNKGNIVEAGDRVLLCRCKRSKNQPFCDGSHMR